MKKIIYYGKAWDLWWYHRFEKFMDGLGYVERLSDLVPKLTTSPRTWYSLQHSVAVKYVLENTLHPEIDGRSLQRAKVTLYGEENNIGELEEILKSESEKHKGEDIPGYRK